MKSSELISDKFMVIYNNYFRLDRQDSAFYTWDGPEWVASVYWNNNSIEIWAVGEMKIQLPEDVLYEPIRYTDKLLEFGIDNDADLYAMSTLYEKYDIWHNNSWFEFRTPNGMWLDEGTLTYVFHDVSEAVDNAYLILENPAYVKELEDVGFSLKALEDPWRR